MIGIGAIVKSMIEVFDNASTAVILGLRLTFGGKRPKPCPIPVKVEPRRRS